MDVEDLVHTGSLQVVRERNLKTLLVDLRRSPGLALQADGPGQVMMGTGHSAVDLSPDRPPPAHLSDLALRNDGSRGIPTMRLAR